MGQPKTLAWEKSLFGLLPGPEKYTLPHCPADRFKRLQQAGFLESLLIDRTTKKQIIWAADTFTSLGDGFGKRDCLSAEALVGRYDVLNRLKGEKRLESTRRHGEVLTPLRICKQMCDYAHKELQSCDWQKYVTATVLEITCGDAPFLVSRYDRQSGRKIAIPDRIGLLDRKLQLINEKAGSRSEWLAWVYKAFQATYGYEFQGYNLLLARINLLKTFQEYALARWEQKPGLVEYEKILEIISWNLWQMDGLTGTIPFGNRKKQDQCGLFGNEKDSATPPCLIRDWQQASRQIFPFWSKDMKFDFIIGNPPYQDDRQGESTTALPVYDKFIDSAYQMGDVVELIHPARFLFKSGRTSKEWNEKMLNDTHLKVLFYESDAAKLFSFTDIKGGVAITYHNMNKIFKPIVNFYKYNEMDSIIEKISITEENFLSDIAFVCTKFNTDNLFRDYPSLRGRERRMSSNVFQYDFFKDYGSDMILIYGVYNGKRIKKFIDKKYVDLADRHIAKYKVIIPKADGNGIFGDSLTNPEILPPQSGFTHTFLGIGEFDNINEAEAVLKYIKTKFSRSLLSVLKVTQNLNADKLKYIPLQDFTSSSDIDWSKSIPEIDQQLYKKYGLDQKEIEFIETHVREMV